MMLATLGVLGLVAVALAGIDLVRDRRAGRARDALWAARPPTAGERRFPVRIAPRRQLRRVFALSGGPVRGVCSISDTEVTVVGASQDGGAIERRYKRESLDVIWLGAPLFGSTRHEWLALGAGDDALAIAQDPTPSLWLPPRPASEANGLYEAITGRPLQVRLGWARLPGCTAGEILEPESPTKRLRALAPLIAPMLVAAALLWYWNRERLATISALIDADRARGTLALAQHTTLVMALIWLAAAASVFALLRFAVRAWRANAWPPPGARVQRRTSVVTGTCLRVRVIAAFAVGLGLLGALSWATTACCGMIWDLHQHEALRAHDRAHAATPGRRTGPTGTSEHGATQP